MSPVQPRGRKPIIHLIIDAGPALGQRLTIPESGLAIGRDRFNDLIIEDDAISGQHCRFFYRAGQLWISDLKSTNGTMVNELPIENAVLQKGDRVAFGATRIRVMNAELGPPEGVGSGLRRATAAAAAAAAPEPPPKRPVLVPGIAWTLLILWWFLLAYSLCLPPPPPAETDAPLTMEAPPAEALDLPEPAPADDPSTAAAEPAPDAAAEPPADDAAEPTPPPGPLTELKHALAERLLKEDYAAAAYLVHSNLVATPAAPETAELQALSQYLTDITAANTRIAAALGAQAGNRITLRNATTNVPFQVVAVSGAKLRGEIQTTTGVREVSLEIGRLHPEDRLAWLGAAGTEPDHALRAVLEAKRGNTAAAQAEARAAGPLANALEALLMSAPGP